MHEPPFRLVADPPADELLDAAAASHGTRVGLSGLLAERGQALRRAWVRGRATVGGYRWRTRDNHDRTWWPQGIDVGSHDGGRVVLVSWYAQPVRGIEQGVRLSVLDLRRPRRARYHHVLLVEPVRDAAGDIRLNPVVVHAGGIAWVEGSVLVADTFGGLREFRLNELLRVSNPVFGYEFVLPQLRRVRAVEVSEPRMRFSFVSIEHGSPHPYLVAGEYRNEGVGDRLVRFELDGEYRVIASGAEPDVVHSPGLWRMQGVCVVDGVWYVTTSNGEWTGGDLWSGTPASGTVSLAAGTMTRHRHVLPAGPEDLAHDRSTGRLWSLSEWPGRRRVFAIDPARLG
ncbi:MAG TPA: hypothetical protein VNT53_11475 [Pseudolysinimonas sp.]|nr:hypothetical protein [Pseudolysinimonas sp.]